MRYPLETDDHQHSEALSFAYGWLKNEAANPNSRYPLIGELRHLFGLSVDEACSVAAQVYNSRGRRWTS